MKKQNQKRGRAKARIRAFLFPQNGWPPSGNRRQWRPSLSSLGLYRRGLVRLCCRCLGRACCLPAAAYAADGTRDGPSWGWRRRSLSCFLRQDWPPTPGGGGRWVGPHTQGVQPSYSRAKFSRRVASPITYSTCSTTLDRLPLSGSRPSSFILTRFHTPTA